jgi:hypothetical protein
MLMISNLILLINYKEITLNKIFIKPAPGFKIRDPESKMHIPEQGEYVVRTPFWTRRILDKDVSIVEPKKEAKEIEAFKKEEKSEKHNMKQGDK